MFQLPSFDFHDNIEKHSFSNVHSLSLSTNPIYSKAVGGPVLRSALTSSSNTEHSKTSSQRYKTELCRSYDETGLCKYGEKCQFAHGLHELRSLNRHPKYKTVLCRTYHCTGYCPYGPRCHFLHDECSETSSYTKISPSCSFASDIRSSVSSSRSISPIDSPMLNTNDDLFHSSFLFNKLNL